MKNCPALYAVANSAGTCSQTVTTLSASWSISITGKGIGANILPDSLNSFATLSQQISANFCRSKSSSLVCGDVARVNSTPPLCQVQFLSYSQDQNNLAHP